MVNHGLKVVGIGSAVVDIFVEAKEEVQAKQLFKINEVVTIDSNQVKHLTERLTSHYVASGGLTANVLRRLVELGVAADFFGTVGTDQLGRTFIKRMEESGVAVSCKKVNGATAQTFILFSHHGSAISYYPGVSSLLDSSILTKLAASNYDLLYSDGYQLTTKQNFKLLQQAIEITRNKNLKIVFGLPAVSFVNRLKQPILAVVANCSLVFGNLNEYLALFQLTNLDQLTASLAKELKQVGFVITNGNQGATYVKGEEIVYFPPTPTDLIKDHTGAGDVFAATFVFGWLKGYNIEKVGKDASSKAAKSLAKLGTNWEVPATEILNTFT